MYDRLKFGAAPPRQIQGHSEWRHKMTTVLITGASGFVGKALAAEMARDHSVVCMSRSRPNVDVHWVRGDFASFEDLMQLDQYPIDIVLHLGAVTGGCLERDGTEGLGEYANSGDPPALVGRRSRSVLFR